MPPIDPTVLATSIATAGSLINGFSQGNMNRKNRKFQAAENQKARDYNTLMWEKNNAYNDPSAQMERLRNAGINPHLAYSQGHMMNTSNAPAAASPSGTVAGIAPQMDVNGLIHAMLQAKKTQAEIDNINAHTENLRANTDNTLTIGAMNKQQLENLPTAIQLDNEMKIANINLTNQEVKESQQKVINLITTDKVLNEQINLMISERELNKQQVQYFLL